MSSWIEKLEALQADLDNATDGLGALKTLIDALPTASEIQTEMEENGASLLDTIRDDLDNATDGLGALKTLIDAIQADLGDFSAQTNLQTLLAALGIPDVAGKPLYTVLVTDLLSHGTFGLSAIKTLIDAIPTVSEIQTEMEENGASLLDTITDELANATDGLSALKTLIDAIQTQVDTTGVVVASRTTAFGRVAAKDQLAATTIDLNQAAATYDLFTGTSQAFILESLNFKCPTGAAGGALTSIAIQTDDATPGVIINPTDGDVSNLTSEADLFWTGSIYITVGTKVRLTIGGGAHGTAYVCNVTAKGRAVVDGGYLA